MAITLFGHALFDAQSVMAFARQQRHHRNHLPLFGAAIMASAVLVNLGRASSMLWLHISAHNGALASDLNAIWLLAVLATQVLLTFLILLLLNGSLREELGRLADFDPLTGLLNRRGIARQFPAQTGKNDNRHAGNVRGVLMIDVDHFKAINDRHGHGVGDDVLVGVARTLTRECRAMDAVGRWGGEEFLLVSIDGEQQGMKQLAERLRTRLELLPMRTRADAVSVTVSIGVAVDPLGKMSLDALSDHADEALLQAKEAGRNRVVVASPYVNSNPAIRGS